MTETVSRTEASGAVTGLGWRYVLGVLRTAVQVGSLAEAAMVAAQAAEACGAAADTSLRVDVRADQAILTLYADGTTSVSRSELALAGQITRALRESGRVTDPQIGGNPRSAQLLEIAIDAMDIAAIRPFWKAVLGYVDETADDGPQSPLVDPLWQGPAVWFQQMDAPRPQRNRIHFDVSVPHDEAHQRIQSAVDAGGRLLSDEEAPAFWVLADAEGNEVCVTTWQGRD